MIKKILVAVDGSKHSMASVTFGAEIAKGVGAKLLLYRVVKPYSLPDALRKFAKAEHMETFDPELLRKGAQYLLSGALDAAREAGVKDVELETEEGPIARSIVERAKTYKADLIVIGSRGMGDMGGMLRGGVSSRVETLAKCAVLVVK
ncbi:MAG: universal stress protein [Hyphomicrobiales bacterium]|nr:universal stress protein [Hyphomicrobiales bacterium]